ncbi:hypothetical protein BC831DRAFT_551145 [Entophlyctis helioformis]|nr:hypothetical protein BC831DRAFT_551145 [Entophlyctis helioformis]
MSTDKTATMPETEGSGYSLSKLKTFVNVISAIAIAAGVMTILSPGIYSSNLASGIINILLGVFGFVAASNPVYAQGFKTAFLTLFFFDTAVSIVGSIVFAVRRDLFIDACIDSNSRASDNPYSICKQAYTNAFYLLVWVSIVRFVLQCVCLYFVDQYANKAQALLAQADPEMGTAAPAAPAVSAAPDAPQSSMTSSS